MAVCLVPHCDQVTGQRLRAASVARGRAGALGQGADPCSLPPPHSRLILILAPCRPGAGSSPPRPWPSLRHVSLNRAGRPAGLHIRAPVLRKGSHMGLLP